MVTSSPVDFQETAVTKNNCEFDQQTTGAINTRTVMAGIKQWKVTEASRLHAISSIPMLTISQPYLQIDCGLGEAPFWEKDAHHLRFVDIIKQKLHVIDLNKGPSSLQSLELDDPVGLVGRYIFLNGQRWMILRPNSTTADIQGSDDEIVVGAKGGYAILNRKTGGIDYLKKLWTADEGAEKEKRSVYSDSLRLCDSYRS